MESAPLSPGLHGAGWERSLPRLLAPILAALRNPHFSAVAGLELALADLAGADRAWCFCLGDDCEAACAGDGREPEDPVPNLSLSREESESLRGVQSCEWRLLIAPPGRWRAAAAMRHAGGCGLGVCLEGKGAPRQIGVQLDLVAGPGLALVTAIADAVDRLKPAPPSDGEGRIEVTMPLVGEPQRSRAEDVFGEFPHIVGRSQAMAGVLHAVLVAARSEIPVLIEGESGTGKELIARAIHDKSSRKRQPFVGENCAAVPESLFEAEIFGHEKGAFTGALRQRPGIFERAAGGTVFLDEIGEMDLSIQRKLLRVLQEREVRRLGGVETVAVDFRLVSATNRVLEDMVAAGHFREDLFYRIQVTTLHMPALRDRADDIPLLVDHFARVFATESGKRPVQFSFSAMEAFVKHRWPGNVRELRNEVWSHSCSDQVFIDLHQLSPRVVGKTRAEQLVSRSHQADGSRMTEVERVLLGQAVAEALKKANGNRTAAARHLCISRASLYRRMLKYNLMDRGTGDRPAADP